jgi:hypothetical protein
MRKGLYFQSNLHERYNLVNVEFLSNAFEKYLAASVPISFPCKMRIGSISKKLTVKIQ